MTPQQRSACIFVKAMSDHIDAKEGRAPSRDTQKRVAHEVRARFFKERPMRKIVIGLTGLAGAGKSTAARFLAQEHGFTVLPFAAGLKAMALAYGLTPDEIGPGKERPFDRPLPPMSMDAARAMLRKLPFNAFRHLHEPEGRITLSPLYAEDAAAYLVDWWRHLHGNFTTPRRFLQLLGTEWGRQMIGETFWVDVWAASLWESAVEHFGDILAVADDCRFENEAAAIRAEDGIVVRIEREGAGSATGASHASEGGVRPDFTLKNDGSPSGLRAQILGLLNRHFAQEAI